ncbi:unnamed protein product [Durusdinium trenchii]|uniref:Uncharacterized protein n=1 Tax=Durusdinium trenchii TaxID=1381693 RepID=A0ABP0N1T7_9DINO
MHGATSAPLSETLHRKRRWYKSKSHQKAYKQSMDLAARKTHLWRSLNRHRLGGFEPHLVRGRFVEPGSSKKASTRSSILSLEQSVVLARTLGGATLGLPGAEELLQQLGDYSAKVANLEKTSPLERQRTLVALSRLASALDRRSPRLFEALEGQKYLGDDAVSVQKHR